MSKVDLRLLPWINLPPFDQYLSQLLYACQLDESNVTVITGPNGAGKSQMMRACATLLLDVDSVQLVMVNARKNSLIYQNILKSTAQLFLNVDKRNQINILFRFIFSDQFKSSGKLCILIDDIEYLTLGSLQFLIDNLNNKAEDIYAFHFIFFMGSKVNDEVVGNRAILESFFPIAIEPMSLLENKVFADKVNNYLQLSLDTSYANIRRLHGMSYGYVGRFLKLLNNEIDNSSVLKYKRYILLGIPLSVLSLCIMIMFFYLKDDEKISSAASFNITIKNDIATDYGINVVRQSEQDIVSLPSIITVPILMPDNILLNKESLSFQKEVDFIVNEADVVENDAEDAKNYVIELSRHDNKSILENQLFGRSIPGKIHYRQVSSNGRIIWVAAIGPYGSMEQAEEGKRKLPASLQSLPLQVREEK